MCFGAFGFVGGLYTWRQVTIMGRPAFGRVLKA